MKIWWRSLGCVYFRIFVCIYRAAFTPNSVKGQASVIVYADSMLAHNGLLLLTDFSSFSIKRQYRTYMHEISNSNFA